MIVNQFCLPGCLIWQNKWVTKKKTATNFVINSIFFRLLFSRIVAKAYPNPAQRGLRPRFEPPCALVSLYPARGETGASGRVNVDW